MVQEILRRKGLSRLGGLIMTKMICQILLNEFLKVDII
jgi:hypothetical protein